MREIKFRAWYRDAGKMCTVESLQFAPNAANILVTDKSGAHYLLDADEAALMQYTGLHDKTGKEIYEGAIVKVFDDDGGSFVSEISWQKDYPAFDLVRWPNHYYDSNALSAIVSGETKQTMEVVGNIYENPELLEDSKDKYAVYSDSGDILIDTFATEEDVLNYVAFSDHEGLKVVELEVRDDD